MMKSYFSMFALYNRWANERLYEAAGKLDDGAYRRERGAFFGSLHRTLNHLVVTDRIWMQRFTGEGPVHTRLDEVPYDDLYALRAARIGEDERIIAWIESLDEEEFAETFTHRTITQPRDVTQQLTPALAHFFNHQTHHRGQAHCLVSEIAGNAAAPSLDLILFQRQSGVGVA
jgi:uncharacterized damage-inducible protein DinB